MIAGQIYKVPTVNGEPILLPAHSENTACIRGGELMHYHYDWRFKVGTVDMRRAERAGNPVVYKDMVCLCDDHPRHPGFIFFFLELLEKYKDTEIHNRKCPHQGVEVGPNGVCPAHGLHWKRSKLKYKDLQFVLLSQDNQELGRGPAKLYNDISIHTRGIFRHLNIQKGEEVVIANREFGLEHVFPKDLVRFRCNFPFAVKANNGEKALLEKP